MIYLLAARTIMRSKFVIMLVWVLSSWSKCQPPDQYYCKFRSHEKWEFQPHDRKFDLLKKLNFDLMKFDLMISSRPKIQFHMIKIKSLDKMFFANLISWSKVLFMSGWVVLRSNNLIEKEKKKDLIKWNRGLWKTESFDQVQNTISINRNSTKRSFPRFFIDPYIPSQY